MTTGLSRYDHYAQSTLVSYAVEGSVLSFSTGNTVAIIVLGTFRITESSIFLDCRSVEIENYFIASSSSSRSQQSEKQLSISISFIANVIGLAVL
jgi:hypothetical protein